MNKSFVVCVFVLVSSFFFVGCGVYGINEPQAVVDTFATAYFNWRFKQAENCVTPSSRKWLRFAASQVVQEDVDSLKAMESAASVEVEQLDDIDDSTMLATVLVRNYIACDSIGSHPHREEKREFKISISLVGDYWRVKLSRLP